MSPDYNVPFYANTPDDTHCFQAVLKMVLKYFLPEKEYSWDELDQITAKQDGMWTWPMAGLCWLNENRFEVISIENFDYQLFVKDKEKYLIDKYGQEIADEQIKYSIIEEEIMWAKKFMDEVSFENRLPSIEEVKSYLDKGYLVIANVNARSLTNREGYVAHFVVIKGYKDNQLILHDPGSEPRENVKVLIKQFMKGWDYPDKSARNMIALKLQ